MNPPSADLDIADFSAKLKQAIDAWRNRHDVPAIEGEVDASWHLSQHGNCDDFAQALSQQLSKLGIEHQLCVMSRVTTDEDGQVVDSNPFSHAFVSIPVDGAEINVDSMGIRADLDFVDAWQDEPGETTEFEYHDFASIDAMRAYLRTPIDGHGTPRSSPDNDSLVATWTASLADELMSAGLSPMPTSSAEAEAADEDFDGDPSIKVYISLYGTATDPEDEDLAEWYCVDVSLARPIEPTADLSPELMHCIHERAMDAFHGSIAIAVLDDFTISAHLDDGRVLEAMDEDPDDISTPSNEKPWDLVLNSEGDVYALSVEEVPVEVDFAATLGDDEPEYRVDLVREYPELATTGSWGYSPLHQAASVGEADVIAALVEAGADIGSLDYQGLAPLHLATTAADAVNALRSLLDLGADLHQKNSNGVSACDHALAAFNGRSGAMWLITQGAVAESDGTLYIDPTVDDLMELSEPENRIAFKDLTPKVAAVIGGHARELMELMSTDPVATSDIDEPDSLRRIAKKAGKEDMVAALDAQRSFQTLRSIAASANPNKKPHP